MKKNKKFHFWQASETHGRQWPCTLCAMDDFQFDAKQVYNYTCKAGMTFPFCVTELCCQRNTIEPGRFCHCAFIHFLTSTLLWQILNCKLFKSLATRHSGPFWSAILNSSETTRLECLRQNQNLGFQISFSVFDHIWSYLTLVYRS